jgi:hypothetical protein
MGTDSRIGGISITINKQYKMFAGKARNIEIIQQNVN